MCCQYTAFTVSDGNSSQKQAFLKFHRASMKHLVGFLENIFPTLTTIHSALRLTVFPKITEIKVFLSVTFPVFQVYFQQKSRLTTFSLQDSSKSGVLVLLPVSVAQREPLCPDLLFLSHHQLKCCPVTRIIRTKHTLLLPLQHF